MNTFRVPHIMPRRIYMTSLSKPSEKMTQAIETWVDTTETPLYNAETSKVIARIRALETQNPAMADVLKREVGYFQKHAHRMQYRTFNEKGYQIGSGVIEPLVNMLSLNAVNKQACDGANPGSMPYSFGDVC